MMNNRSMLQSLIATSLILSQCALPMASWASPKSWSDTSQTTIMTEKNAVTYSTPVLPWPYNTDSISNNHATASSTPNTEAPQQVSTLTPAAPPTPLWPVTNAMPDPSSATTSTSSDTQPPVTQQQPPTPPLKGNVQMNAAPTPPAIAPQTTAIQHIAVPVTPQSDQPSLRNLVIPPDTVLNVTLNQDLSSKDSKLGQDVTATVKDALFLGPYTVIPAGSTLSGQIVQLNRKTDDQGHHPYLVVLFDQIKMSTVPDTLPFHATMIAYKTGMRAQDYIWKLPNKNDSTRRNINNVIGLTVAGILVNPIAGGPIGLGAGLAKNKMDNEGNRPVKIKANDQLPIAIDQEITLPVMMTPLHRLNTAETPAANAEHTVSYKVP